MGYMAQSHTVGYRAAGIQTQLCRQARARCLSIYPRAMTKKEAEPREVGHREREIGQEREGGSSRKSGEKVEEERMRGYRGGGGEALS